MGAPRLVYLSTDEARRERLAEQLRDVGFEVVTGSLDAGAPLVEKVHPSGVVLDFAGAVELAGDLAAWLRTTAPHRDQPTFAINVPADTEGALGAKAPGIRLIDGDAVEAVREVFVGQMGFMVQHKGRGVAYDGETDTMIV